MTFKAWGILLIISMLNFGAAFSVWAFANHAYSAIGWSYSIGVHDGYGDSSGIYFRNTRLYIGCNPGYDALLHDCTIGVDYR